MKCAGIHVQMIADAEEGTTLSPMRYTATFVIVIGNKDVTYLLVRQGVSSLLF